MSAVLPIRPGAPPALTRQVLRILAAIATFQFAFFLLWTAGVADAERQGWGATKVGFFAALPWLAVLAGLVGAPEVIRRVGTRGTVAIAILLHGAGAAGFVAGGEAALWTGGALLGLGLALRWIAVDVWLVGVSPPGPSAALSPPPRRSPAWP